MIENQRSLREQKLIVLTKGLYYQLVENGDSIDYLTKNITSLPARLVESLNRAVKVLLQSDTVSSRTPLDFYYGSGPFLEDKDKSTLGIDYLTIKDISEDDFEVIKDDNVANGIILLVPLEVLSEELVTELSKRRMIADMFYDKLINKLDMIYGKDRVKEHLIDIYSNCLLHTL